MILKDPRNQNSSLTVPVAVNSTQPAISMHLTRPNTMVSYFAALWLENEMETVSTYLRDVLVDFKYESTV